MFQKNGQLSEPFLMIHGGAGTPDPHVEAFQEASKAIKEIALEAVHPRHRGLGTHERILLALKLLESHPRFNAGFGSSLQRDGIARLTAAYMDGGKQSFSAVIGATDLHHPSELAFALQGRKTRILAHPGTELLSRQLQIPVASPISPERRQRWFQNTSDPNQEGNGALDACDTVGALIFDGQLLYAGASTGGRGGEIPGRVSDTCTVAGTYASAYAAILATGVGEQIIDDALAARLETRVRDGMALEKASHKAYTEAQERKRHYGWIAADRHGAYAYAHTTPKMTYALVTLTGQLVEWSA
jgi:L-asparaginase